MDDKYLLDLVVAINGCEAKKEDLLHTHEKKHVEIYGGPKYNGKEIPKEIELMQCGGTGVATDTVYNGNFL